MAKGKAKSVKSDSGDAGNGIGSDGDEVGKTDLNMDDSAVAVMRGGVEEQMKKATEAEMK